LPDPKHGKKLLSATAQLVNSFYNDEELTREMPGKKDSISIGSCKHKQKHLILCNLNEFIAAFKLKHPEIKLGFSKFCSLRPKWCILAGAAGTPSVFVCVIYLLLVPVRLDYDLIQYLVCGTENQNCMIRRCKDWRNNFVGLQGVVKESLQDCDEGRNIQFSQLKTTDHSTMVIQQESVEDYIDLIVRNLEKLITHSYIAKAQAKYLKKRKQDLEEEIGIIVSAPFILLSFTALKKAH